MAKSPEWKGFTFVQMERTHLFTTADNNKIARIHSRNLKIFSSWTSWPILWYILVIITSLKCIHWFELVSQVNDVAHGPLFFLDYNRFFAFIYKPFFFYFMELVEDFGMLLLAILIKDSTKFLKRIRLAFKFSTRNIFQAETC